ncbi:MAG: hypothetical protein IJS45_02305 [Clostridia bacterium]|nr:hypothetical protein [Clostridia bacterium]
MQNVKMRVIYSTTKKKVLTFATAIAEAFKCQSDDVPPAFPCDKEKLVVIVMSIKDEANDKLRRFCGELNKTRALNTVLVVDGEPNSKGVNQVKEILKEAGTNVIEEVYTVDGGGIFGKKISLEERRDIVNWVQKIIDETFGSAN